MPLPACHVCLHQCWSMGTLAFFLCSFWLSCTSDGCSPVQSVLHLQGLPVLGMKRVTHLFPLRNFPIQVQVCDRPISLYRSTQWMKEQAQVTAKCFCSVPHPQAFDSALGKASSGTFNPTTNDPAGTAKSATVINSGLRRRASTSKGAYSMCLHPTSLGSWESPILCPRAETRPWSVNGSWVQKLMKCAVRSIWNKLAIL